MATKRARPTIRRGEYEGCWHYDFTMFCTQCDPASYGPCEDDCPYNHEHADDDNDEDADLRGCGVDQEEPPDAGHSDFR